MLEQLKTHSPASFPAWRSVDLSRAVALAMDTSLLRSVHTSGWQSGVQVGIIVFEPQCGELAEIMG